MLKILKILLLCRGWYFVNKNDRISEIKDLKEKIDYIYKNLYKLQLLDYKELKILLRYI